MIFVSKEWKKYPSESKVKDNKSEDTNFVIQILAKK